MGVLESVTLMLKFDVPAGPLGVPLIVQVLAFRLSPAGNVPTTEYVSGVVPPLAEHDDEYDTPTVPLARLLELKDNTGAIVTLKAWVATCAVGEELSVTFTVKYEVPAALGVPVMEEPLMLRPAGKELLLIDHV